MSNEFPATLDDGSVPATPDVLLRCLADLGIEVETVHHAPVFTVEEAKAVRGEPSGGHTKNLFLRNKKGRMWLVVCPEDRRIDLKALGQQLGAALIHHELHHAFVGGGHGQQNWAREKEGKK